MLPSCYGVSSDHLGIARPGLRVTYRIKHSCFGFWRTGDDRNTGIRGYAVEPRADGIRHPHLRIPVEEEHQAVLVGGERILAVKAVQRLVGFFRSGGTVSGS